MIKGALRRAFARSALHDAAIAASIIPGYSDPDRPRVKTWCRCKSCGKPEAKSYVVVDHRDPVVPVTRSLEDMTIQELFERLWCDAGNLDTLCPTCHKAKTSQENKERRTLKKKVANETL